MLEISISTISLILWFIMHSLISEFFDLTFSIYISTILWEGLLAVVVVCFLFRK